MIIAIIGILSTTLAPKLRRSLAKAKDAKAVAVLGAARIAGSVAVTDRMVKNESGTLTITFEDITSGLDTKTNELIDDTNDNKIPVGGIEKDDGTFKYGGTVMLNDGTQNLTESTTSITVTDDLQLILTTGTEGDKSTEGKLWTSY